MNAAQIADVRKARLELADADRPSAFLDWVLTAEPDAVEVDHVGTVFTMEPLVPGGTVQYHATLHCALPAGTKLYSSAAAAAFDPVKSIAVEELCQLGYRFEDDRLIPPDNLHLIMQAIGHPLVAKLDASAAARCTCPSGDGSLAWPCPAHPAPAAEHEAFQYWADDQWDGRPAPHNAWLGFRAGVIYGRTQADAPVAEPVALTDEQIAACISRAENGHPYHSLIRGDRSVTHFARLFANEITKLYTHPLAHADAKDADRWRKFRGRDVYEGIDADQFINVLGDEADALIDSAKLSKGARG